jgi:hypothetical protein
MRFRNGKKNGINKKKSGIKSGRTKGKVRNTNLSFVMGSRNSS